MKKAALLIFFVLGCDKAQDCNTLDGNIVTLSAAKSEVRSGDSYDFGFFKSCSEVQDHVENVIANRNLQYSQQWEADQCPAQSDVYAQMPEDTDSSVNQPTNVQEAGVDESDRVKISMHYIFYARPNAVEVVRRSNQKHVTSLAFNGSWSPRLFLHDETLLVINSISPSVAESWDLIGALSPEAQSRLELVTFDVRGDIKELSKKVFPGSFQNSRLSKDGILTLFTASSMYYSNDRDEQRIQLQKLLSTMDCQKVSIPPKYDSSLTLTQLTTIDLQQPDLSSVKKTHLIGSFFDHYQNQSLYLTRYPSAFVSVNYEKQSIYRLDFENKQWQEKVHFPLVGRTVGSWSFKEMDPYLYVVSNPRFSMETQTLFSVYKNSDDGIELVDQIQEIALGERLQSVRFAEDYVYLVTFRDVDPLFVIDLHDREKPKVVSELKAPGFSSYLHNTSQNELVGVGYSEDGNVQISLFDVENPLQPKTLDQLSVSGQWSSSSAQHDHHSFFYDDETRLLSLPVVQSSRTSSSSISTSYFYRVKEDQLNFVTKLSHEEWEKNCQTQQAPALATTPMKGTIQRVHRIDDKLFTFSDLGMKTHPLAAPEIELQALRFPEAQECR